MADYYDPQQNEELRHRDYFDHLLKEYDDLVTSIHNFKKWLDDDHLASLGMQPSGYVCYDGWRRKVSEARNLLAQLCLTGFELAITISNAGMYVSAVEHQRGYLDEFERLLDDHQSKHGDKFS